MYEKVHIHEINILSSLSETYNNFLKTSKQLSCARNTAHVKKIKLSLKNSNY